MMSNVVITQVIVMILLGPALIGILGLAIIVKRRTIRQLAMTAALLVTGPALVWLSQSFVVDCGGSKCAEASENADYRQLMAIILGFVWLLGSIVRGVYLHNQRFVNSGSGR
jgi:hypothetical protein